MRRIILATLLLHLPPVVSADGLANAYLVCDIFEKTGISTECQASNVTSTVDVILATTGEEAQQVCLVVADRMAQMGRAFGGRWQLRIFAPDRAAEPLAACALR
ncbi:MAG: hypothetical protein EXR82_02700 [Gammaproteobacteria bacterium]|nr:hypothetical protein [Gammaproteobacteria bacterium]